MKMCLGCVSRCWVNGTPIFMQRFFARLKVGKSASQALTETKREMAADPKTAHPSNWAAFILVGAG